VNELTLESLARRVEAIERQLASQRSGERKKDWRRVVGIFEDTEFSRAVDEEGRKIREADREAAERGERAE
jgi:hypothetical protein